MFEKRMGRFHGIKADLHLIASLICLSLLPFASSTGVNLTQNNSPSIYVVQEDKGILRLISVSPNSGKTRLVYTGAVEKGLPVFRKQNLILFKTSKELSLFNLSLGKSEPILGSQDAFPGNSGFFKEKPWLLFSRKSNNRWETVVYDYEKRKEEKVLPGTQPFLSADHRYVFLIGNEVKYSEHGEDSLRVPVHRYEPETDSLVTIAWVESGKEKLQLLDVYGLSDDLVVVRAATEKENRLYHLTVSQGELVKLDKVFYPSKTNEDPKEQFNVSASSDGKTLVFTERSEGKFGYLVVIDLVLKQRFESAFLGSFPVIKNGVVYFLCDPKFVKGTKETEYKPYSSYTLYSLDYKKDRIRAITPLSGKAEVLE
ncbi:hypothetical protein EHO61_10805 [Leptospira fluminis]|uniref:S9 family peptidase n=1 Tax=Leptospira fluminis TaxID=2484979 RepID=A0A4R9GPU9_9LEPT|nr:hypothetical protein [Leptospira fluminis]TGK17945.1 hypothetical protein EHO61_10805 [Leptospira fluminis]